MIRLVKIANNLHRVELENINIWFSYETPVAFMSFGGGKSDGLYITKNIWSPTTGKHLNIINPDKSIRIEHSEFIKLLMEALK